MCSSCGPTSTTSATSASTQTSLLRTVRLLSRLSSLMIISRSSSISLFVLFYQYIFLSILMFPFSYIYQAIVCIHISFPHTLSFLFLSFSLSSLPPLSCIDRFLFRSQTLFVLISLSLFPSLSLSLILVQLCSTGFLLQWVQAQLLKHTRRNLPGRSSHIENQVGNFLIGYSGLTKGINLKETVITDGRTKWVICMGRFALKEIVGHIALAIF